MRDFLRAACAALLTALAVGCNNDDAVSSKAATETSASIGPVGGSLEVAGLVKLEVSPNTFATQQQLTLSASEDPTLDNLFQDSAALFNDLDGYSTSIVVKVSRLPDSGGKMELIVTLPTLFADRIPVGGSVVALVRRDDTTADPEVAESHSYFEGVVSNYDSATKRLTLIVDAATFRRIREDAWEAAFKIAIARPFHARTNADHKMPLSISSGRPTFADPLANPIVVAAFKQPRDGLSHGGTDFRAQTSVPVYSMASGHIKMVKVQSCNCSNLTAACDDGNPGFAVTIRHDDGSTAVYRHINRGSINGFTDDERCWVQPLSSAAKYSVAAGQQIALSGSTGTAAPHLHVEYSANNDPNSPPNRQNIFRAYGRLKFADDYATFDLKQDPVIRVVMVRPNGTEFVHKRSETGTLLPITALGSGFATGNNYPAVDLWDVITSDQSITTERFDKIKYTTSGIVHDNGETRLVPQAAVMPTSIVVTARDPASYANIDSLTIPVRVRVEGMANFIQTTLATTTGTPIRRNASCNGTPCQAVMFCTPPSDVGVTEEYVLHVSLDSKTGIARISDALGDYSFSNQSIDVTETIAKHEVTPSGSFGRFFSEGSIRVRATVDVTKRQISGTVVEEISTLWDLDGSRVSCSATANVLIMMRP